jgi:hypothetical protein
MEWNPIPPGHLYGYQKKRVAGGGICKDMRAKELPFVPQGEWEQGFRHGDEAERLVGDSGFRSRLMLLDEYRTRQGKFIKRLKRKGMGKAPAKNRDFL